EAARTDGDTRSPTARNADTLVRWATEDLQRQSAGDSLATDAHTIRTHMLFTCTPDQLATAGATSHTDDAPDGAAPTLTDLIEADLAGAGPVSPSIIGTHHPLTRAALRRLACDATLTLAVLRTPGQDTCPAGCPPSQPGRVCEHLAQPLYVGRSARTISGLQFKALVLRDRHCVVKGCHRPPAQCAGHHVKHWADGGTTDLDNLVLLCHAHHHDHHDRGHDLPHHDGQRWLTQTGWGRAPT
ncbi:MAG TPA: HNH endonuclease signature motif containing protein, partial [Mycobacteriales bacterium]|nr:HNH endonuclease signature motif containing protein [Mycobacteriales bacterium]